MSQELYLNKQFSKIIGIKPRIVQHWTDKGLLSPAKEASRGGTKHWYNYLNLVEGGISKDLYDKGYGIQSIKKMLSIIRDRSGIDEWIDDHLSYFNKLYKSGGPFALLSNNIKAKEFARSIQRMLVYEPLELKKTTGILFYFFSGILNRKPCILPMVELYGNQEVRDGSHLIYSLLTQQEGVLLINIGKIREDIDKKLISK